MNFNKMSFKRSTNSDKRISTSFFLKLLFLLPIIIIGLTSFYSLKHPFYLGVTELKHDNKEKSMNITIRLFTSDLEDALKKTTQQKIDILNPQNKAEVDSALFRYIKKRFSVSINSQPYQLTYLGYEKQEESIYTYLEITNAPLPQKIIIDNTLLYDFIPQQTNIIHTEVNSIKKSTKLNQPKSKSLFVF